MLTFSTVGLYHHIGQHTTDTSALSWCILIISMVPPACISLGLNSILHILKGELFPTEIRAVSAGIVSVTSHIPVVINMVTFPVITSAGLLHLAMYVYSSFCLFMAMWAIITIKNTDDMSLVEVEELYKKERRGWKKFAVWQSRSYDLPQC